MDDQYPTVATSPTLKIRHNGWIKLIKQNLSLSPKFSLNVQRLIQLLVFHTRKLITLKRRLRRSEGFLIGSSLPSHGVRVRTKTQEKEPKRKTKGRLQVSTKKKNNNNNII